jgi:hypothetical protein
MDLDSFVEQWAAVHAMGSGPDGAPESSSSPHRS